jgi:hypothetical protein
VLRADGFVGSHVGEIEGDPLTERDREERACGYGIRQPEQLRQEPGGLVLIVRRDNGVVQ